MNEAIKGIPVLIDAFRKIRESASDVELVIVGKPGSELDRAGPLPPGLHYIGPRYGQDLSRLLASADVFMGASRHETFWLAPLEAMASGTPIVVSRVGAVPEMVSPEGAEGRAVALVDSVGRFLPNAAQRLCDATLPLVRDEQLRIRMGMAARRRAESVFSEQGLGERLLAVFRKALGPRQE